DRFTLQLDLDAHTRLVRVVGEVGDLRQHLVVDELGDLPDQALVAALLDPVRKLGDNDRGLPAAQLLDVCAGADNDPPAAGAIGVANATPADDDPARRKVGAPDVSHQLLDVRVRLVDQLHDRVDRL